MGLGHLLRTPFIGMMNIDLLFQGKPNAYNLL